MNRAIYIVGFTLAGLLAAVAMLWIALRFFRRTFQAKRAEERGAAFLNVRGVVQEMNEPVSHFLSNQPTTVVFPQKAVVPRPAQIARPSRHDHISASQVPAECDAPLPRPRALSGLNPSHPRHSRGSSVSSGHSRSFPQPPGLRSLHSPDSSRSSFSTQARKVRQFFQPVLPDELPLSRMGEQLHVVQSFDDGWCLVAQNNSRRSRASFSLFNPSRLSARVESNGENVQLGLVPAWVFIRPMKGLRVERPIRSSSAGVLQAGLGAAESRDAVISWSNFS